ncbi:CPBP family intramembrane glutamic endopeptidase [Halapricum hydrolyticum]|uniref:CPBP family intramembrane metalloprotease n=1 Tax=Halapricum hydrolyticum TaxID=2979991 RepID=A0AAE3IBQ9_9EURY|nr:type II CAAX endopeptidase family protein [Halapricum hydrolyticum]MCU4717896.1 CPBP family intramembrane metalloprotease [Halapricum hydrolyticum]MCU4727061.1 CPBP family intramembrane metalloprotease [Halapricum hydrolyticum]
MGRSDLPQKGAVKSIVVGAGLTVFGVVGTFVGGIVAGILLVLGGDSLPTPVAGAFVLSVVEATYLVIGVAYVSRTRITVPWERPSADEIRWAAWGSLGAVAIAIVVFLGIDAAGLSLQTRLEAEAGNISVLQFLSILAAFVAVAVSEEYLFRGAIQRRLELGLGDWGGLAVASLLFGSIHVFNYNGEAVALLLAVLALSLVGAVMGYAYQRTENLAVPVIVHYSYNVTVFVLATLGFQLV